MLFRSQTLSFGYQYIFRERDADSAAYGFRAPTNNPSFDETPNLLVSDVVNSENNTGTDDTGLEFDVDTLASDSYESDLTQVAAYVSYDLLVDSTYQFVVGARFEDFELNTETFLTTGDGGLADNDPLDTTNVLPAFSFNWLYSDSLQLRFAFSETLSRPDFKERSNAIFYDREFNFRVRGNPDLQESKITNFDLRWENYWNDTENLSVAIFYKEITDAIERVVQTGAGQAANSRTFINSPEAELYGVEVDGRVDFGLNDALTQTIFLAGNASIIESEVQLSNSNRALQGQPEYTFNLILGWDDLENGQELTLLFNQNGDTIVDTGLGRLPDVNQEPFADLKLNYKKSFGEDLKLSIKLSNLLNSEVEFTQGGTVIQSYKGGVEAQAGIDWSF